MVCPGEYGGWLYIENNHEGDKVTLHVGLMARDGIVLAGDIWTYTDAPSATENPPVWAADARSKIAIVGENMAISRAHDLRQARLVADAISAELSREHWGNPEQQLEAIASSALAREDTWRVHCLVVLRYPSPSLFKIECGKDSTTRENVCFCTRALGYALGGDCHNPATFFSTRYFLSEPPKDWTVSELVPFAVQMVVDASQINSGTIRGLEVVYCDSNGFHRLSPDECRAWEIEARKRSHTIGTLITSPMPLS